MKTAALPARLATAAVLTATLCIFPSCSEKPVAKPLENTSPAAAPASQLVTAAPAQPEMPLQTAIAPQAVSVSPPTQAAAKPQPPAPPPEPPIDIKSEEVTTLLATIKEKGAVLATWKEGDPIDEETAKACRQSLMKLAKLRIRVPANDLAAWDTQLNEARKDFLSFSRLQQKDRLEDLTGKLQNLKQKQADRKDGERRRPVVPTLPDTPAAPAAAK